MERSGGPFKPAPGLSGAIRGRVFPLPVRAMHIAALQGNAPLKQRTLEWATFCSLLIRQSLDAGKFFAFEEFERSSAAGGDVSNLVRYAGLSDC